MDDSNRKRKRPRWNDEVHKLYGIRVPSYVFGGPRKKKERCLSVDTFMEGNGKDYWEDDYEAM